jgi:hypothetical protein
MVVYFLSQSQGGINRRIIVQAGLGIKPDPISKITNAEGTGAVTQVVECLFSKPEALNSTPINA